jgi:hypothetical protein
MNSRLDEKLQKIGWQILFHSFWSFIFILAAFIFVRAWWQVFAVLLLNYWFYRMLVECHDIRDTNKDIKVFLFKGRNLEIERIIFDYDSRHEGSVDCEHGAVGEQPKTMR